MVKINNTNLSVSPVCMGTATLGLNMSDSEVDRLLGTYTEKGGNFLDTAHVYSNWIPGERSRSEKAIGRWIHSRGGRHNLIIGTKGAHPEIGPQVPEGPQDRMCERELRLDLHESLSFLKTDYIDIYWLHRDNPDYEVEYILSVLEDFVKEGKIRSYGCSNWSLPRVKEAAEVAEEKGWQGFCASQIEWSCAKVNPLSSGDPTMVRMTGEIWDYHRETGMPLIPYASQAQGLYSKVGSSGWDSLNEGTKNKYDLEENREIYSLIEEYGRDTRISPAAFTLAYHFSQPRSVQSIPIIGTTRTDRVTESLSNTSIRVPSGLIGEINRILFR